MSFIDLFQCLVCNTYFDSLVKVEKHIFQRHESEKGMVRGKLPIQKVIFAECFIPIVKNQIDHNFLQQCETVVKKEDRSLGLLDAGDDESPTLGQLSRPLRKSRVRATQKIREAVLEKRKMSNSASSEDEEEYINFETENDEEDDRFEKLMFQKIAGQRHKTYHDKNTKVAHRKLSRDNVVLGPAKSVTSEGSRSSKKTPVGAIPCPVLDCKFETNSFIPLQRHFNFHCLAEKNELAPNSVQDWDGKRFKDFFTCKFCLTSCNSLKNLTEHLKKHEMKPCPLCPEGTCKTESKIWEYLAHMTQNHLDVLDPFKDLERKKLLSQGMKFECDICEMKFCSNFVLQRHIRRIHEKKKEESKEETKKPFVCPVCGNGFQTKKNLRLHLNLHSDKNPWVCEFPECGRKFVSKYVLRRHIKLVHSDKSKMKEQNKCPLCRRSLSDKNSVRRHLLQVHKIAPDFINIEAHKYNSGKEDGKKLKSDTDADPVTINTETEPTNSIKQEYLEDKRLLKDPNIPLKAADGTSEASFQCPHCTESFYRAWILQQHLTTVHQKTILEQVPNSEGKPLLMCGTCAYPAKDKKDLENHFKANHKKKSFKCDKCGLNFENLDKMKNHQQRIHFGKRKFSCKVCKKRFVTNDILRQHMKTHEDRKPCQVCHKMFAPTSLPTHLRRHERDRKKTNGEKIESKHKCGVCKDHFATALSLQRHIDAIHLGKPVNRNQILSKKDSKDYFKNVMIELGLPDIKTEKFQTNINPVNKREEESDTNEKNEVSETAGSGVDCEGSYSIFGV